VIQNMVRPVAQLTKKNAKFGAVWQMNACRTLLPGGNNGAERSIRSFGVATWVVPPSHACPSDCRSAAMTPDEMPRELEKDDGHATARLPQIGALRGMVNPSKKVRGAP
jgi:hypothetical protein